MDQEEQSEDESSIPTWLAKIGSLYGPLGGSTSTDGIWILATAADLGKDCNAKSVPLPQHYNQARVDGVGESNCSRACTAESQKRMDRSRSFIGC